MYKYNNRIKITKKADSSTAAKKGFPIFYTVYFSLLAVGIIAVAVLLFQLTGWLDDYEHSLPKYKAEEVFGEYYRDGVKYRELLAFSEYSLSEFESSESLERFLAEQNSGDISYYKVSSGVDDTVCKYNVLMGEVKISSFTIKKSDEMLGSFSLYGLDSVEFFYNPREYVTVTVPAGYELYLNGVKVSPEYITERDIRTESCDYMPDGVSGIMLEKYEVDGLLFAPTVEVKDSLGELAVTEGDADSREYKASVVYDLALKEEHGEDILNALKEYAVYMQGDTYFGAISGYFDKSSDLYEMIRTVENMFVIDHYSWSFSGESIGEFYRYDDRTFSCRVSFTHLLHRYGSDDYRDFVDMTLYLREIDGKYYIYNRKNH